jgi:hypothetical protein
MATLTGQFISQSYGGIIQLSTNTGIVSGSYTQLQDGVGNNLGIWLNGGSTGSASTASLASMKVSGSLTVFYGLRVDQSDLDIGLGNINVTNGNINQAVGATNLRNTTITGSLGVSAGITSTAGITNTGSFAISGSIVARGNASISGSTRIEVRALSISSQTASMDLSTSDLFTLTLVSGSTTFINPTNIQRGQTSMLQITQPSGGGGSVSFNTSAKFPAGFAYTASFGSNVVDTIAFVSFDGSTLRSVASYNFQ